MEPTGSAGEGLKEAPAEKVSNEAPARPARAVRRWLLDLSAGVFVTMFTILFVYQPVKVEGSSMQPGLADQERIFINKLVYRLESVQRGDIVVFRYPRDPDKSFIKRVIGIPGDRVRVTDGRVFLNGELLDEPYVPDDYLDSRSYRETIVPDGTYFVLGDHRSMSNDSRDFGPVPRTNIYGKAVFGYWPADKVGVLR
ncbi:MAG TPA: signal peptidase I [Alphaproteobacteria bacterium]|nr:signal peptidase I [Alphaproteobacteria bacterium]